MLIVPINGRIIKTANSDNLVVMSGMKEIMVLGMEVYREALKDVRKFIEFEVELQMIREDYFYHYEIIIPQNLFENYEEEKRTPDAGGEDSEEKG